jgi:serine/threonine-protein kinase RsbW
VASVLEMRIPARPEFVAVVRLVVATAAKTRRLVDDDRVDDLKLAVSEACTNAIEASGETGPDERVRVVVEEDVNHLVVTVADQGPGFDPDDLPVHPPVTDPERLNFERGLGIPLIRTLVDDVSFRSDGVGTSVRMLIRCPAAPGPVEFEDFDLEE